MNSHAKPADRPAAGIYPFWFWNDALSAEEIRRQIDLMAEQGVRGFFIHPRQGLRQPYLSQRFFAMVDVAVEAAEARGLEVHLYDEYPYPSGPAGGEVLLGRPAFHATRLVQQTHDVAGGRVRVELPAGKVLACVGVPLRDGRPDWEAATDLREHVGMVLGEDSYFVHGLTMYNPKRYFASQPRPVLDAELPAGPHRLFVSVQAIVQHHRYWSHFADVMNPAAVREFLRVTHERYWQRFAGRFGGVIRSVFVDETEPRWTDGLPEAFAERYGRPLPPLLPALQDPTHPQHVAVLSDLRRLQYERFCEAWEGPYSAWCREHGILYGGEKPSWRLSQLAWMDLPGCDPGHTKAGAAMDLLRTHIRGNARATASAAYCYHKAASLCECYHSMGWSATLQDARLIADGLLLMGIDMLVPHGFFYSTHALRKHDAPPTFFFQMPSWGLFGRLSRRVETIGAAFADTHIDARVLVVDPNWGLPSGPQRGTYERLLARLMAEHIDFLMVDTDILQAADLRDGAVGIREVTAPVVVVPPMQVTEPPLAEWLGRFEAAGGTVVCCDDDEGRTVEQVLATVQPSLRIEADGGAAEVYAVTRRDGTRRCWLLLNTARRAIDLRLDAGGPLREVPLEPQTPGLLERTDGGYRRALAPFEAVLLASADAADAAALPPPVTLPVGGAARVTPRQANLLRLYDWRMALVDADGRAGPEAEVPAVPLINQLTAGGFAFAPALEEHWGTVSQLRLPRLHVRYTVTFVNRCEQRVWLVMEPDSIVGEWSIRVNDCRPIVAADFSPVDMHVRGSLGAEVTGHLRPDANTLVVDVTTDRHDGGLLNALYLAGDFGVALDGPTLTPRQASGAFEAYEANGLPYYAGLVEYEMDVAVPDAPADRDVLATFDFGAAFEDACEVSLNGGAWHALPWSPRRTLLPAGTLRPGANQLRVRVFTSLGRAFEGQAFDPIAHRYRDVR